MFSSELRHLFSSNWLAILITATFTIGCGDPVDESSTDLEENPPVVEPGELDDSNLTGAQNTQSTDETEINVDSTSFNIAKDASPNQVIKQFLAAMKDGDKPIVAALLTEKARIETSKHNLVVQPPGSPSAQFKVGKVETVKGGAYVNSSWSEIPPGKTVAREFEIIWVMKNQKDGWRVAGMATRITPESSPTFLNFENPEEMLSRIESAGNPSESAVEVAGN
tara:strand:- start:8886 stop:9554 length:669 start_codon:yes stop_codon:yes gene_type:complete